MNNLSFKKLVVLFLCICIMSTSLISPVLASGQSNFDIKSVEGRQNNIQKTVRVLTKYVVRNEDGTFKLEIPKGISKKINKDILLEITSGMQLINSLIREGKLKSTESLAVYDPKVNSYCIQGGLNKLSYGWWGFQIFLDSTNTNRLMAIMTAGGGAVTIVAAISGMIPGGQIISGFAWIGTGLIALGIGAIAYHAAPGYGISISCFTPLMVLPFVPPLYLSSQGPLIA